MTNKAQDIPLFPVAGWAIGPFREQPAIIVRLDYLASPSDRPEGANHGLHHVLNVTQARELAREILEAARQAESGAPSSGQSPTG